MNTEPVPDASGTDASGELLELLYSILRGVRRESGPYAPGQLRFLRTLAGCGCAQRPGSLADALGVAPRSVTSKVDVAEAEGLVQRLPDPTDRRATLVELTSAGHALLADAAHQRHEHIAARLARLPEPEQTELLRLLRVVGAD
ncbi:MarR family winged helix-turn-helix transcriptional regulator [Cellulomonas sp. URHD0024]|uniref:MarR family winged helix-turn-helix transcriptional regulator n=1 Tax=Cellulomonas sp. URHD0024 TaxID=1302620 RepID=UPI0003FBD22D|nr:MarR family winged helix-turn-helix transcriptional regulator [Cellulomonas sp. URHD0024]